MQKLIKIGTETPEMLENLTRIEDFMTSDLMSKGRFKFFEFTFPKAFTALQVAHRLGFVPKDILQLSVSQSDGSTVTWHFDDFTSTYIYVTTSGACTVRAFIGRYGEQP